jgi:hypothetical protein
VTDTSGTNWGLVALGGAAIIMACLFVPAVLMVKK